MISAKALLVKAVEYRTIHLFEEHLVGLLGFFQSSCGYSSGKWTKQAIGLLMDHIN
jgi:hypothetical protein